MRRIAAARRSVVSGLVVIALLSALLPAWGAVAAGTAVSVSPSAKNAVVGDTFSLDVVITSDTGIMGYEFGLAYNPAVVKINSVSPATWLNSWAVANGGFTFQAGPWTPDLSTGTTSVGGVGVIGGSGAGATGTGTLATISLTAIATGSSPVSVVSFNANTRTTAGSIASIPNIVVADGQVVVGSGQTPTTTASATSTTVPTATPTNTPSPTATGTPKPAASPTAVATRPAGANSYPWDVNNDGKCDINDVVLVNVNWGWTGTPGTNPADINGDGKVNIEDVVILQAHWGWALGNTSTPSSTPTPSPSATAMPSPSETTTASATAAAATRTSTATALASTNTATASAASGGSVTVTPTTTSGGATATRTNTSVPQVSTDTPTPTVVANATIAVSPAGRSVQAGDTFTMDVVIDSDAGVMGYEFGLAFNPAVVVVNDVAGGDWLSNWATAHGGFTFPAGPWTVDTVAGTVTVGGIGVLGATGAGPAGHGTLATISLTALAPGSSPVRIVSANASLRTTWGSTISFPSLAVNGSQVTVVGAGTPTATATPPAGATATPTWSAPPSWTPSVTETPTTVPTAEATVVIDPPTKAVNLNDKFTVNVKLTTATMSRGIEFGLSYDPAFVKVDGVAIGTYYKNYAQAHQGAAVIISSPFTVNNSNGKVAIGSIMLTGGPVGGGAIGSDAVAIISMTALAPGTSALTLDGVTVNLYNQYGQQYSPVVDVANGQITVGSQTSTPTPTATGAATHTPTSTATQSATATATTASSGTATPTRTVQANLTNTPTPPPIVSNSSVSISPATKNVNAGDTFTLDVTVSSDRITRGIQFGLTFDKSVLKVNSVAEGTFYTGWASANGASTIQPATWDPDNSAGKVSTGGTSLLSAVVGDTSGPTGSGVAATISFTALADGTAAVTITELELTTPYAGNSVSIPDVHINNGQVTVGDVTPTGTPGTPTGTGTPGTPVGTGTPGTPTGTGTPGTPHATGTAAVSTALARLPAAALTAVANGTPIAEVLGPEMGGLPGAETGQADAAGANGGQPGAAGASGGLPGQAGGAGAATDAMQAALMLSPVTINLWGSMDDAGVLQRDLSYNVLSGTVSLRLKQGTKALDKDGKRLSAIDVKVILPPRAVERDVVGVGYDFGPDGATFDPPLIVTLPYDTSALPEGVTANTLTLGYFDAAASRWVPLEGDVDTSAGTVTGKASHFTPYAVVTGGAASGFSWVLVAGVLLAEGGLGAAGYVYLKRRRKAKNASFDTHEWSEWDEYLDTDVQPEEQWCEPRAVVRLLPPGPTIQGRRGVIMLPARLSADPLATAEPSRDESFVEGELVVDEVSPADEAGPPELLPDVDLATEPVASTAVAEITVQQGHQILDHALNGRHPTVGERPPMDDAGEEVLHG